MNAIRFLNTLGVILLVALPPTADASDRAADPSPDQTLSPYFHVRTAPTTATVDPFPLKDTHVEVTIAGVIAEVSVTQTYANTGTVPLEAVYVFPGSTRAAVHGLTMFVGDRVVRAQIQPKHTARRTYEAAKSAGQTASLLEQHRPNVFHMNLAHIPPGETVQAELRYTELLRAEEGAYEFVFPTVVGPRYSRRSLGDELSTLTDRPLPTYADTAGPSAPTFGLKVHLATGVPLAGISCATHAVQITRERPDRARVTLDSAVDTASHANRDFILRYHLSGGTVQTGLLHSGRGTAEEPGYFLAMVQPPARPRAADAPPREYVFIVDVSGSMSGFPLETAQTLLSELLSDLGPVDTFNVALFAGSTRMLAPESLAATPENLAAAIVLLERERGGGGSELLSALERALLLPRREGASRTFVVVTDGFVTIEAETFMNVRCHLDRANVFAFGIGASVNRHLIEGLARAGLGEPCIVTRADDAPAAAERFRRFIANPVLTGVRARFEGITVSDIAPTALPDVFAERPVILFGRWQGPPAGRIQVSGTNAAGSFNATLDVATATHLPDSRALELLWARQQISDLDDLEACHPTGPYAEAITQLGLKHGLITKYTSFVAVDQVVRSPATNPARVSQPLPLPTDAGAAALGEPVPTTPEPATVGLLVLLAAALGWMRWGQRRVGNAVP